MRRATQRTETAGDWSDLRKPPARIPDDATRPAPLLFDDQHRPITSREGWLKRRAEIEKRWSEFLVVYPRVETAPKFTVLEEDRPEGVVRQLIRYEAEPGLPVEGYLLRPQGPATSKRRGVVVLHSTADHTIRQPAGLEGDTRQHIGLELARRGYVAMCPRNYLWQYGRPTKLMEAVDWLNSTDQGLTAQVRKAAGRVTGMAKMLFDSVRALDLLASLPDVDTGRIAAYGHSLGAKEVLYLAAFDPRVRAAVSSEGGIGLSYSNWEAPWYLGSAIQRPDFGLDHGQVLAMVAPRSFLLLGGDSADGDRSWPYIEATLPVWRLMGRPEGVGLINHKQGHALPDEIRMRTYEWLDLALA